MKISRDKLILVICEAYTALEDERIEDAKNTLKDTYKDIKYPELSVPLTYALNDGVMTSKKQKDGK